jgi:hypothetical protein
LVNTCVKFGDSEDDGVVTLVASSVAFSAFVNCSKANSKSSLRARTVAADGRSVLIAQN